RRGGFAYRWWLPGLTGCTRSGGAGPGPLARNGGDERIRTADPLVANEVLSQLSYIPKSETAIAARRWAAHRPSPPHTNREPGTLQGAEAGGERGIRTLEAV